MVVWEPDWKGLFMVQIVLLFEWSATSRDLTFYPYCQVFRWIRFSGVQFSDGYCTSFTYGLRFLANYLLCNLKLIILADWQASARNWELDDENDEQNDHVNEQTHLQKLNNNKTRAVRGAMVL